MPWGREHPPLSPLGGLVFLSPTDLAEIARIIQSKHDAYTAALFGPGVVPAAYWDAAIEAGFVDPSDPPEGLLESLHSYGAYLAALDDPTLAASTTVEEFKEALRRDPITRTPVERHAAQASLSRGAQHVRGLGNRVKESLGLTLTAAEHDLANDLRGKIRDSVAARAGDVDAMKRIKDALGDKKLDADFFRQRFRGSMERLTSDIRSTTKEFSRDVRKVAATEAHQAFQEGLAEKWKESAPPKDILVYRNVRDTACPACRRLYLQGGNPRVFKLAHLEGHGPNNVGRRRAEWLPVNGATHPYCTCSTIRLSRFVSIPKSWTSGEAMPTVLGPAGYILEE